MDINQALENLRIALSDYRRYANRPTSPSDEMIDAAEAVADAAEAIDQWLSKGGYLPKDWRVNV